MAPSSPRSGTRAAIRGGTEVVPAENEMSARASASSRASMSSRPSTCARLKYRTLFTIRLETSLDGVLRERAARLDQRVRSFRRVDVAIRIDGDAFARRALVHPVFALEGRDERRDAIFVERPDAHAVTPV